MIRDPRAATMPEDRGPDSLDAHVRKLMADLGLFGYHTRNSKGSTAGWPDWVIIGRVGILYRELKTEHGTVTPEQAPRRRAHHPGRRQLGGMAAPAPARRHHRAPARRPRRDPGDAVRVSNCSVSRILRGSCLIRPGKGSAGR